MLTNYQVRGAFANYVDEQKSDFKSIAASGYGDQSQASLSELQTLFAASNEEDFDDTEYSGVMTSEEIKIKKEDLKAVNAEWKAHLKEIKALATNLFIELQVLGFLPK
ncbi:hypothetical protein [Candidatus Enterovibrio escicola]|uniref:hypothetical protein n=1 Tax=Candidatus Enterovibrio escicola TaxID=1927127 RepID=UPI0018F1FB39|nr:hypothetical protein [Candidatus Enterovibrio escacola]